MSEPPFGPASGSETPTETGAIIIDDWIGSGRPGINDESATRPKPGSPVVAGPEAPTACRGWTVGLVRYGTSVFAIGLPMPVARS